MGTVTQRTLADRFGGIARQIRALGRDPSEWEPADLQAIDHLRTVLSALQDTVVYGLRETGFTDREIGEALGVTQQAVSKRWPGGGRYVGAAGRYRTTPPATGDR